MNSVVLDQTNPAPLFDVGAVLKTLWRRRILVLGVALLVVLAAGAYTVLTKPSYTASAAILVDPRDAKTTNIDSVLPGIGADSAAIASQVSVIESRDLLGKVYASLDLATDPEYAGGGGLLSGLLSFGKAPRAPNAEVAFQKFLGSVGVEREGLTYVIDVTVKSGDPAKAAKIANAIVDQYIGSTAAQQNDATTDVTATLNGKIGALQNDVSTAEHAVAGFKQQHDILDDTTGGTLQSQTDQLTTQLIAAKDALNQAQTKLDQASAAGTSPADFAQLSDVSSSPATDQLRNDYNTKAAALASAQATFGPKHPTVVTARAELNKVQGLLEREANRIARQLKADRDAAQMNVDKLQAGLAGLRQQSNAASAAQVQLAQLQRQADAARAVLSDFMQRSQETSQMQGLQNSQVHVISAAAPPPDPTWPKPMLLLPVSAVLGLMLGCGVALLLGDVKLSPLPAPVPAGPEKPRREVLKPVPTRTPVSQARRFASLDSAKGEIFAGLDTPLTRSIQQSLKQILGNLPRHGKPYVLAVSAIRDADLATAGATLLATGLERIGARALVIGDSDSADIASDQNFILVDSRHALAATADLDILVLTPEEDRLRPANSQRLTLVLDLAAASERPRLVASNRNAAALAAV
jgi:uncharacterized protein involved in exopolysaccharide biosynthesis